VRALTEVGVDVIGLVDFADVIFEDDDELSFGRFMEIVLELRGSNSATVKDIIELRKLLRNTTTDTHFILGRMEGLVEEFVRQARKMEETKHGREPTLIHSVDSDHRRDTWCPGEQHHAHAHHHRLHDDINGHAHVVEYRDSKSEDQLRDPLLAYMHHGFADLVHRLEALGNDAGFHKGDDLVAKDLRGAWGSSSKEPPAKSREDTTPHKVKLEPIVAFETPSGNPPVLSAPEEKPSKLNPHIDGASSTPIKPSASKVTDKDERIRSRVSQHVSKISPHQRELSEEALQRLRSRVSQLAKHLKSGLVEVNEIQRALALG
jgi:hypothetical protein